MRRSYQRRSAEQRVAEIQKKIADLKAKQLAREKKDDPVLRELRKLMKRLKSFVQHAHDHKRPDIANSVMGFKAMLERILASETGAGSGARGGKDEDDDE